MKTKVIAITIILLVSLFLHGCGEKEKDLFISEKNEVVVHQPIEEKGKGIIVEIKGHVLKPGVYILDDHQRLNDLLILCGGATENANLRHVNLAMKIMDGDSFYIPSLDDEIEIYPSSNEGGKNQDGKIDLNKATKEDLMTVTGIGPATADNILAYRDENGPFKTVDGLLQVNRIGEKTLDKIKDSFIVR